MTETFKFCSIIRTSKCLVRTKIRSKSELVSKIHTNVVLTQENTDGSKYQKEGKKSIKTEALKALVYLRTGYLT